MLDPKKYDNQNDWMDACMHSMRREEGKPQQQSVAVCLSKWRNKDKKKKGQKKCAADYVRGLAYRLMETETAC